MPAAIVLADASWRLRVARRGTPVPRFRPAPRRALRGACARDGRGDEHAERDHDAGDDAHDEVPGDRVVGDAAQRRAARAEQQDRERQHDDPPGEQARALVVARGELGGQRDVGHLEQAERRRGER